MEDHTNRALIVVMIVILIIILILYFLPHGIYFTNPGTVTVQRTMPTRPAMETHVYTSTGPATTYQQQTYTTTEHTTTTQQ